MKWRYIHLLLLSFSILSCDKEIGSDGVVLDGKTNVRLSEVKVIMVSDQKEVASSTDNFGYFNVYGIFNCGLSSCNDDYTITFTKMGYEEKTINNGYASSPEATWVNPELKDTLIIKLDEK